MNKKITVIIPVYNTKRHIRKCIESVMNQTYKNLEIIIVDDGSVDGSASICDEYQAIDDRIKVIHKVNEGPGIARNTGLDIATGDYIAFVDSDDEIKKDMYEMMQEAMERNGASIAVCGVIGNHVFVKKKYDRPSKETIYNTEELLVSYFREPYITGVLTNKLFEAILFKDMRFARMKAREDIQILYQILGKAKKAVFVPESFYVQLIRPGSIEHSGLNDDKMKNADIFLEADKYMREHFPNSAYSTELLVANSYKNLIRDIVKEKGLENRKELYNRAFENFKRELKKCKNHDSRNDKKYRELYEIYKNQKKFIRKCRLEGLKEDVLFLIKNIAIQFGE